MDSLSFHSASDLAGGGGGGGGFDQPTEKPGHFKLVSKDGIFSRPTGIGFLPDDVLPSSSSNVGTSSLEPTSRLEPTPRLDLSEGALAGIIVAAVVVTLIVVGVVLWVHLRRRKSKSQELNVELSSHPPTQPVQTHFNLAMEPEAKMAASRQNSLTSNGGPPSFRSINEEDEEFTDYGSVMGSFPPSPTLSFRSVVDGPGFSRSRSGTGTSFGTVASFASDWTRRSRASTTASFHTCVEEDFTNTPPS